MDELRLKRFDRHIVLDQIGLSGQVRFSKSIVSVIGAGGLGSPALLYLVAAGIGEIRIIDDDEVDIELAKADPTLRKRRWCEKGGFCS